MALMCLRPALSHQEPTGGAIHQTSDNPLQVVRTDRLVDHILDGKCPIRNGGISADPQDDCPSAQVTSGLYALAKGLKGCRYARWQKPEDTTCGSVVVGNTLGELHFDVQCGAEATSA